MVVVGGVLSAIGVEVKNSPDADVTVRSEPGGRTIDTVAV